MKETFVSAEIAKAMKMTVRAVRLRAQRENWPYLEERARGGARKLYLYASLPKNVQQALQIWWMDRAVEENKALVAAHSLQPPAKRFAGETPAPPDAHPTPLLPWQEKKALARIDLVRRYQEDSTRNTNGGGLVAAKKLFIQAYNSGQIYPELHAVLGAKSFQTLERWLLTAKRSTGSKDGRRGRLPHQDACATGDLITALAPRHGEDRRGLRQMGGVAGDLEGLIESEAGKVLLGVALHSNRPRIAEAIRTARMIMAVKGVPNPESDATYHRFLLDFKARHYDQWVFYREGEHALDEKCLPYLEGSYDFEVGDVLVADGHILNWDTLNPWTGKPKRMTMILWWDMKSSFPLGWEVMPTENTQAIAAALHRAILRLGVIPKVPYMDNGRAFGSKYFGGKNLKECGFEGLFSRLGMRPVYAWPYHGMSKPIERFFGTFGEIERLAPSYTGANIMDKPPWRNRGEKLHVRMHRKMTRGQVPTLEETLQAIGAWFDLYVQRPQRGKLEGKSPLEVFLEWYDRPERAAEPGVGEADLRHLMMNAVVKTIGRNGVKLPGKGHYYATELYGRKHQVVVRYDDQDPRAVWIYGLDGEFICRAESRAQVHRMAILGDDEDRAEVKGQIEEKLHLKKDTVASARAFTEQVMLPETQEKMKLLGWGGQTSPAAAPDKILSLPSAQELDDQIAAAEARQAEAEAREEANFWQRLRELPDQDRYERLLELEVKGKQLPHEDMAWMHYFEQTEKYELCRGYFEDRRFLFSMDVKSEAL